MRMPEYSAYNVKEIPSPVKRSISMKSLKERLLSRTATLSLIIVIVTAVLAATLIPQRFLATEAQMGEWRAANRGLLPLVDKLGLHHVYTTSWFAGFILLASLSLLLSASSQFRTAWRRTFALPAGRDQGAVRITGPVDRLAEALRKRGYLRMAGGKRLRYVKHPWGYWGNVLLHVGMLITIAASLYIALTDQRGILYLTEGEVRAPGAPWESEAHGMLAGPLTVPEEVRLDRLDLQFNPDTTVDRVASELSFLSVTGAATKKIVAINSILFHQGLRIYQNSSYGDAFTVEFTDAAGNLHREKLRIPHPLRIDKAGYEEFELPWSPYGLSTKYYADAANTSMNSPNQLLVLRFMEKEREIARVTLKPGESGVLGDVKVRLVGVERWSSLIFVNVTGMPVIFFGFCIMVLGGFIHYCTPPREVLIDRSGDACFLSWKAARFGEFYRDEYQSIITAIDTESA
jgi:cytochrome c biogenesis protein